MTFTVVEYTIGANAPGLATLVVDVAHQTDLDCDGRRFVDRCSTALAEHVAGLAV